MVRALAHLVGVAVVGAVLAGGGYAYVHDVLQPAEHVASGPVPDGTIRSNLTRPYSPSPSTTAPRRPAPRRPGGAAPPVAVVTAGLGVLTAGMRQAVVLTPAGYEAATYDQYGDIDFWAYRPAGWALQARRLYPSYATTGATPGAVSVRGQLLTGMTDATFVVDGPFAPAGREVAYTTGPEGWGAVTATSQGRLQSEGGSLTAPGPGLDLADRFVDGRLETVDDPDVFSATFDASFPVVRTWVWSDDAFVLAGANIATAQLGDLPAAPIRPLPSGAAAPDGVYAAQLLGVSELGTATFPLLRLDLQPVYGIRGCRGDAGATCFYPAAAAVTVVVGARTPTLFAALTQARSLVSVTGPAWALAAPGGLCCTGSSLRPVPTGLTRYGVDQWYVPPGLDLEGFVDGTQPVLEVTVAGGAVRQLAELAA